MQWRGETPYEVVSSPDGRFFFDVSRVDDTGRNYDVVLRRWSDGKRVPKFSGVRVNKNYQPPLAFGADGQSIFWVQNGTLWRQRPAALA